MTSVGRALSLMELLALKESMSLSAIVQELALPLASTHRLLSELAEHGVVERTADGEWQLSYKLLEIAGRQLGRLHWPRLARPYAETIAREAGETVNMSAVTGTRGVVVDKVQAHGSPRLDFPIGAGGPLYLGGAGKAVLAFMRDEELEEVINGELRPFTKFTITSAKALTAELGRIRAQGFAIDRQEVVIGVWCVAVPIFDRSGYPIGALSITGPSKKRVGPELMPKVRILSDACQKVSRRMGFIGPWPGTDNGHETTEPEPAGDTNRGATAQLGAAN